MGFLLLAALCLISLHGIASSLEAQTAYFSGTTTTLLSTGLSTPYGVAIDASGNVFIADSGDNQVKEIVAAGGMVKTLGSGNDFLNPQGVAVDRSGNVFVADTDNRAIKEILAPGYTTVSTIASGLSNPYGVAVDSTDNVFVADTFSNTVKKFLAPGYLTFNTLGSGFNDPTGVAVDASGNVFVADYGNNLVKEILALDGTVLQLGSSYGGPTSVAVDGSGNVFFADEFPNHIDELVAAGDYTTLKVYLGNLNFPTGVAVDGKGNLFVADRSNNMIKEIMTQGVNLGAANIATGPALNATLSFSFLTGGTISGSTVSTQGNSGQDFTDAGTGDTCIAGTYNDFDTCTVNVSFTPSVSGTRSGAVTLNDSSGAVLATAYLYGTGLGPQLTFSPATSGQLPAALLNPGGVAVDGSGNLFVADTGNSAVKEILAAGGTVVPLGGGFSSPTSVALDGAGNLFVADAGNNSVKEVLAAGGYTTVTAIGSGFSAPLGVAVDSFGDVFVADTGNNAVKEILPAGGYTVTNTLGSGFANPTSVAVDVSGNVFVADSGNNAIKEILVAAGYTALTPIGNGFSAPNGVAVDAGGNVFVADAGNNLVKEILATGGYATVNIVSSAFTHPTEVAVDGSGNVFVADPNNNAIAKLNFADAPSLNFASTPVGSTSSDSPQTVTLNNIGNGPLTFPPPATGLNPAISTGFTLNGGSTCPKVSSTSSAATLLAGSSCTDSMSFTPTVQGTIMGSLVTQDDNLNAPSPGFTTQTISLNGTATAMSPTIVFSVPDHLYGDPPFTVVATSNSTGAFTYSVVSGPATIAAGTATVTITGVGTVVLMASEAADSNYIAGSTDATFNVAPAPPAIVFNVPNHVYGDPPFTVSATSNSTGAFTYSVVSGPATIAGSTVTLTGAGTVVLRASEAADSNYTAGSQDVTFTVAGNAPAIVFNVPNHVYGDPPFAVSATSNSTGAFTYSVVSGPATIAGNTITTTGAGTVVLMASEAADANYTAGSKDATFIVAAGTPAIVFTVPNHNAGDAPFTVSAASNSTGAFTYSVVSGPATIAGSTVTLTGPGTVVLQASEAADANFAAGSRDATFTVAGTMPAIVFTVPNHQYTDVPFAVSASSNAPGAFTYSVVSGPATIVGATVTLTGAGQVVLQALQAAGGGYSAGSADTTFAVSGSITLSVTPDTATVNPGAVATYTLTVTPAGSTTFADPVNFAAFGLPDGYSYTFAPATLPAGSAATSVKLSVQTTTAAANEKNPFPGTPFASLALAFLMLPLVATRSSRTLLRKMASRPTALLILLLSMGAVLGLSGCGSGVFKTPHKYDIAIIATDSTTTVTTTTEVGLIVQ